MTKLWTTLRHNQGLTVSFIIAVVALLLMYGCQSQVRSLKQDGRLVNRSELELELQNVVSEFELRVSDLNHQDEIRTALFSLGQRLASGQSVGAPGVLLVLGNILGLGAVIDNRRKDVAIKTLKNNNAPSKKKTT